MQGQQQRSRFDWRGFLSGTAEIVVGKITKRKFAIARALPQELGFDPRRHRFGKAQ